jgi:hypothetical protein
MSQENLEIVMGLSPGPHPIGTSTTFGIAGRVVWAAMGSKLAELGTDPVRLVSSLPRQ